MPLHKAFERVDDNNRGADENGTFDISWRIIIRHRHLSLPGARAFVFCPHSHSITRSSGPIPLPARSCAFNGHVCADWRAVLSCAQNHTGNEAAHKSKQSQVDRVVRQALGLAVNTIGGCLFAWFKHVETRSASAAGAGALAHRQSTWSHMDASKKVQ